MHREAVVAALLGFALIVVLAYAAEKLVDALWNFFMQASPWIRTALMVTAVALLCVQLGALLVTHYIDRRLGWKISVTAVSVILSSLLVYVAVYLYLLSKISSVENGVVAIVLNPGWFYQALPILIGIVAACFFGLASSRREHTAYAVLVAGLLCVVLTATVFNDFLMDVWEKALNSFTSKTGAVPKASLLEEIAVAKEDWGLLRIYYLNETMAAKLRHCVFNPCLPDDVECLLSCVVKQSLK